MKRITASQYQTSERYYKLPKLLFESERYKNMKLEVKVVYSVLKDRLELSLSKGWIDEDGANRWHKMWHVTLPSLRPTVVTLFILNAGGIMQVGFEKVFLMSSPATYEVSDVLSTYVYRQGILNSDFSYSAAVGLFNNIVALLFVLLANKIAKKLGEEGIV